MLQRVQDERPDKSDDQVFASISNTLKIRPIGCDFTIKKGGVMNANFILRVVRNALEINGGYCGGNDKHARSILLPFLDLQFYQNYVQIPSTIKIMSKSPGPPKFE